MTDPARRILSLESRLEAAEAVADAVVNWLFFNGTAKDTEDAALAYEAHHGRRVPGRSRDGWVDW